MSTSLVTPDTGIYRIDVSVTSLIDVSGRLSSTGREEDGPKCRVNYIRVKQTEGPVDSRCSILSVVMTVVS